MSDDKEKQQSPGPRVSPDTSIVVSPLHPDRIGIVARIATPRQNEEGVCDVCQRLIDHLNLNGGNWSSPIVLSGPEQGIDCISHSSGNTLNMQVTRAMRDPEFWATLGKHKSARAYTTREQLARDLWESISNKANQTPRASRASVTLVLDASELFAHHHQDTVNLFRTKYGEKAVALEFSAIWIVGGHRIFVAQLI
jgi:hypothetical protein